MNTPLLDKALWTRPLLCGVLGLVISVLLGLYSVTFNMGHGTDLVTLMYFSYGGFLALPISFAAAAAPRRFLTFALPIAFVAVCLHLAWATLIYQSDTLDRSRFDQLQPYTRSDARTFGLCVAAAEIAPLVVVIGRLLLTKPKA